ncbi:MAG: GvpL/GvpF family gas vesicle protein [Actinobacteria bacterium]|nr:GvpL/GvpF family gas vesicle protein [Actinomycetota bacterium]
MEERDLDAAIEALAVQLAVRVVEEARAEAIAEVRAELSGRLTATLLRHCEAELAPGGDAEPEREPVPGPTPERTAAPPLPLAEHARHEATGRYVYGVVRAGTLLPGDLAGIEPISRVRLIECRGLAALVSDVPLSAFDDTSLRENLDNVAWLEEKARTHEEVLEAALAATAVVPLRLGTVFAGEEQVTEMLGREYGALLDALERLAGRTEWGLKAYVDREGLEREALRRARRAEADANQGAAAGTGYMNHRRRREAEAREGVEAIADEWAWEIHHRLAAVADEALLNPLQLPELSGHQGKMLLNGVYLIADEGASDFRSAVRVLAEGFDRRGVEVVLTGPWPAYNFVKSSIEAAR